MYVCFVDWAGTIDMEACEAQEMLPIEPCSKQGWEVAHQCNPEMGNWADLLVPPKEAA